jgi:hypothetical protein
LNWTKVEKSFAALKQIDLESQMDLFSSKFDATDEKDIRTPAHTRTHPRTPLTKLPEKEFRCGVVEIFVKYSSYKLYMNHIIKLQNKKSHLRFLTYIFVYYIQV